MAQHDYNLAAHQSGLSLRSDLNDVLAAIASNNSGNTAPAETFAGMFFLDSSTTPGTLKMRDITDSSWVNVGILSDGFGISAKGANVASAATTNIWSAMDGLSLHITGTTNITSLGTAPKAGTWKFLIFDGTLTLTHNASTLVLPGAANITTSANNMFLVYADTTTKMLVYPIGSGSVTTEVGTAGQLQRTNATTLTLMPFNGNQVYISGSNMTIPAAGISITTSGLSASTLYYVYAYNNSGTMALEISATAPAARDTTVGIRYKTGDTSRTLVGMSRTDDSTQFTAATTRSWFNRQKTTVSGAVSTNRTTTSTSVAEINSETRAHFVCWDDDILHSHASSLSNNSGAGTIGLAVAVDAGLTVVSRKAAGSGTGAQNISCSGSYTGLSTGYHYATLVGQVSSGTATYQAGFTGGDNAGFTLTIDGKD